MRSIAIISNLILALSLGCSQGSASPTVINQAVGPAPRMTDGHAEGGLIVYTMTERYPVQEETSSDLVYYYPHSSYEILSADGKHVQNVINHVGDHDEQPQRVDLPTGRYKIRASSEKDGVLLIPIVIKSGRTTVLNLDQKDKIEKVNGAGTKLVKSPSGQIIGWKAE